jgi:hypothetical protein
MRAMIRGLAVAALIGTFTLALALAGVLFIIPALIYRHWRRQMHTSKGT